MRSYLKIILMFQFIFLSLQSKKKLAETEISILLPNIWEDEVVSRMIRDVLLRNLVEENEHKQSKRQHKREIYSSTASPVVRAQTIKKVTLTSQRSRKPTKATQTGGNTTKNRVTSATLSTSKKATVKPITEPIVTNLGTTSLNSAVNSSKIKPSVQPTKYHYYPHHQQPYFLPECAIQQVCNAVYVRLNLTQPLCVCPPRYRDPCSLSLNEDDNHTITLVGNANKKAVTLAKTCEQVNELRDCRAPRDWSILALQNSRTGKSHYLVICKCPSNFRLEGPLPHDQPTYAGLPGINVYGMLCVPQSSKNTFGQWKISQRPTILSSYRTKNTTIEALPDAHKESTSDR